ncbi:MAG: M48 family metalloprotease [Clostridia bacterium]|nr:M48 family metalloprotease [Clostridia bacterium]
MYLFDLFANIIRKKNFGVLIWFIINTALVTFLFGLILSEAIVEIEPALAYLSGFLIYLVTIIAALSPIGEAIVRWQTGCRKIKDPQVLARVEYLFNEVKEAAVAKDSSLAKKIHFFISDDEAPNAFATGRKTVCITEGLLELGDEEIKGVLAHEFGHLANKDTDVLLMVAVGNMFVTLVAMLASAVIRAFNWLFGFIISLAMDEGGCVVGFLTSLVNGAVNLLFGAAMWVWTKLGVLICMTSSRQNEYFADKFAYDIGYGTRLKEALIALEGEDIPKAKGLWATLNSSHPETIKRIEKLDSYTADARSGCQRVSVDYDAPTEYIREEDFMNGGYEHTRIYGKAKQSYDDGETVLLLRGFSGMPQGLSQAEAAPKKSEPVRFNPEPPVYKAPEQQAYVAPQPQVKANPPQGYTSVGFGYVSNEPLNPAPQPQYTGGYQASQAPVSGGIPGLAFHKFMLYVSLPLTVIMGIVALLSYSQVLSTYGINPFRAATVVICVAQIILAICSITEFIKRDKRAFGSLLTVSGLGMLLQLALAGDNMMAYELAGLGTEGAVAGTVISVIMMGAMFFALYFYYSKRKTILFDN